MIRQAACAALVLLPSVTWAGPRDGVAVLRLVDDVSRRLVTAVASADPSARRSAGSVVVARHFDAQTLTDRCLHRRYGVDDVDRDWIAQFLVERVAERLQQWLAPVEAEAPRPGKLEIDRTDVQVTGKTAVVSLNVKVDGRPAAALQAHLVRRGKTWRVWNLRGPGVNLQRQYKAHLLRMLRDGGVERLMDEIHRQIDVVDPFAR